MCTNDEEEIHRNAAQTFDVNLYDILQALNGTGSQNDNVKISPEAVGLVLERRPSQHLDSADPLLQPLAACHNCGTERKDFIHCDTCERRWYCSTDCQTQHQHLHGAMCVRYAYDASMRRYRDGKTPTWKPGGENFTFRPDYGCRNIYWGRPLEQKAPQSGPNICYAWSLFASIALTSLFWDLHECDNPKCCERRQMLLETAPACRWTPFRDYILTMFSCHNSFIMLVYLDQIVKCMQNPFGKKFTSIPKYPCFDVYGIFSLWRWAYRFYFGPLNNPVINDFDFKGYELQTVDLAALCSDRNLCLSRFWNLTLQSKDAAVHLVHIASMVEKFPLSADKIPRHGQCTDQLCLYSHENSDMVPQTHKCRSGTCSDVYRFPMDALNDLYTGSGSHAWRQSAWSIDTHRLCGSSDKYIAISHVWSDGTGVGEKGSGQVNQCLLGFFSGIAKSLDCIGVWWDAICLPSGRDQRRKALNVMLHNYENATYTVVHDQELARFEWRDDGSPAVALILSAWFTRGWTAAELYASRKHKVKVLFASAASPGYVLKDLDDEILVMHITMPGGRWEMFHELPNPNGILPLGLVSTMGHFMASDILRQLRPDAEEDEDFEPMDVTRNLIRLLNSRTTAWPRDKLLIAGLLCLPTFAFESTTSSVEVTQRMLVQQKYLNMTDLLHGCATMKPAGPWSWCPPSIFDFGHAYSSTLFGTFPNAQVLDNGMLHCGTAFLIFPLREDDELFPLSSHPAVTRKISLAQSHSKKCMLLEPFMNLQHQRGSEYILACPVKMVKDSVEWIDELANQSGGLYDFLACQWIGCVRANIGQREPAKKVGILFGDDIDENGDQLPPINVEPLIWDLARRQRKVIFELIRRKQSLFDISEARYIQILGIEPDD